MPAVKETRELIQLSNTREGEDEVVEDGLSLDGQGMKVRRLPLEIPTLDVHLRKFQG
jgi:hypothetical protein